MRWLTGDEQQPDPGPTHLAPIRIFTSDIELTGFVAPTGQRITDMLLRGQDLAFLPSGAPERPENWVAISPAEILFAVPPPLGIQPGWQAQRELREISVRVGAYRVRGTVHVEPGVSDPASPSTRTFLPLTNAWVAGAGRSDDERFDVVIVNLARSTIG